MACDSRVLIVADCGRYRRPSGTWVRVTLRMVEAQNSRSFRWRNPGSEPGLRQCFPYRRDLAWKDKTTRRFSAGLDFSLKMAGDCVIDLECGLVLPAKAGPEPEANSEALFGVDSVSESVCIQLFH